MSEPDTLPVAFARLARRRGGVTALDDGAERTTWGELAALARLLALAFDAAGMGRGEPVTVTIPEGGLRIAVDQAVLALGGITTAEGDGVGTSWRVDLGGLSRGHGEVTPHPALLAQGRAANRAGPDRFERLAAAVSPGDVAVTNGGHRFTHDQVLWGLRSVSSWLAPMVRDIEAGTGAGAGGAGVDVVVPGGWHEPGRAVLGVWWPLTAGATVHVVDPAAGTTAVVATMASARPVVAVAEPATWAALASGVRCHPALDRSAAGRRYLGSGRASAAGERLGPVERLGRWALDRTRGSRLRRDLGLDRCRLAVSLGQPDEAVRRDLAAVGLHLAVAFLADGVVGPVTATVPGSPAWFSGTPLPGRTVSVERGEVVVGGGGLGASDGSDVGDSGPRRTGRHGRLTPDGQLRLSSSP